MTAHQLYDEIKAFLNHVGLKFSEMDKVEVRFEAGGVVFSYGHYEMLLKVGDTATPKPPMSPPPPPPSRSRA